MNYTLRDYQQKCVADCMGFIESSVKGPQVVVLPTGSGKSWVIAEIAKQYPHGILVLQSSVEILKQNYEKFCLVGGEASLYSASVKSKEISHVTYATLGSVSGMGGVFRESGVRLLLLDECHDGIKPNKGSQFKKFIDDLKPEKAIGFTATPYRLRTNSLGSQIKMITRTRPGFFKDIIHVTQIQDIISKGFWAESKDEVWNFDESGLVINSTGAEYTDQSIRQVIEKNGVNNNIYARLKVLTTKHKSILVFVDSVDNAEKFASLFPAISAVVSSRTKPKDRQEIIRKFKTGEIQIVFNYGILTTGFDFPELECVVYGSVTNSMALFSQIYGRGTRISKGKDSFIFIDCCNNFKRLGHPRNISVEKLEGYGWGVFCGERVMTGVILNSEIPVYKSDLGKKVYASITDDTMSFGKYKGKKIDYLVKTDTQYLQWVMEQDWCNPDLKKIIQTKLKPVYIDAN